MKRFLCVLSVVLAFGLWERPRPVRADQSKYSARPLPCQEISHDSPVRATLVVHTNAVWSVGFSPDGRTLASGSDDRTVKLWDVATGKKRATLAGHKDWVLSVSFSPDGKTLASGSLDGK
jgi:WD40 repeat protein